MADFLTTLEVIARLRMIRERRGLSVRTVADKVGMKRATLGALFSGGRKNITWDELRLLAEVLDVDPREVVHRHGPELCGTCHDTPPAGFSCNACGAVAD